MMRIGVGVVALLMSSIVALSFAFPDSVVSRVLRVPAFIEAPVRSVTPANAVESASQIQTTDQIPASAYQQGAYCEALY